MRNKKEPRNKKVNAEKNEVYKKWKSEWTADREKEGVSIGQDVFYKLFCEGYDYSVKSTEVNKGKNFLVKYLFLFIPIIVCVVIGIGVIGVLEKFLADTVKLDIEMVRNLIDIVKVVGISLFIICTASIASKWNDIRKYQETWARHSLHKHKLGIEMLKYIEGIEPYKNKALIGKLRTEIFIERIIELWNENEEIFVNNMTEKEKGLMDMFDKWSVKRDSDKE